MEYSYERSNSVVLDHLVVEEGLDRGGEGRLCVRGWGEVVEGEYKLVVEGRSRLGGGWGRGEVVLNVVSDFSSPFVPLRRKQSIDCEELWGDNIDDLYGIITYPSGKVYFPATMRGEGMMVMAKGVMKGCEEVDMSKELFYENSTFDWRFLFFFVCSVSILFILFHLFILFY